MKDPRLNLQFDWKMSVLAFVILLGLLAVGWYIFWIVVKLGTLIASWFS